MAQENLVSAEEIQKHSTAEDCWIVVDDNVWDMTEYAPDHPGGVGVIYKHAGRDATAAYSEIHAPSVLKENLDASKYIGKLDKSTITEEWTRPPPEKTPELKLEEKPPLQTILSCFDFEEVARNTLSKKTWAFYRFACASLIYNLQADKGESSAATDCITRDANRSFFDRAWWRPRILRNVRKSSTRSRMLGADVSLPLFISPAALAKLVNQDGEKAMARACVSKSIMQFISSNASFPVSEIVSQTPETQPFVFQLYVNTDRQKTKDLLMHVLSLRPRIRAICVTVDAAVPGKREPDERLKADESLVAPNSGSKSKNDSKGGGLGRIMGSYIDAGLCWEDLKWIREIVGPDMPLMLKGIQTAADAKTALDAGMQGIIVSNHGGRSLDTSPPVLLILLELHKCCPEIFSHMEVYVDGGIRRGTDILKCLCLGATGVGIGRHFLYALNYGQEGVEHMVDVLKDELETTMRLVGITDLSQAHPGLLNTADLDHLIPSTPDRHPYISWRPRARL